MSTNDNDQVPKETVAELRARLSRSSSGAAAQIVRERMARQEANPVNLAGAGAEAAEAATARRMQGAVDYTQVKADLHARVLAELSARSLLDASDEAIISHTREFVARVLAQESLPLNAFERLRLAEEVEQEAIGIGPLAAVAADPSVTDILVNGPYQVYVERHGRLELAPVRFLDNQHLVRVIERIAARYGRRIDAAAPMADLRLPDGSRVNATLPPVSPDGATLSIRRFGRTRLRFDELAQRGMFSPPMRDFMAAVVRARLNILVCGGTGAGKSTVLGALCECIHDAERIVTVEDTIELLLDQPHVVRLEGRPANVEGKGRIGIEELLVNSLRMRPDRILVGEVRGGEALVMLQALNTGHDGGMSTIHANAPREAISRLETMILMSGVDLPLRAIREQICAAIDVIVHVRRHRDGVRRLDSITEVLSLEGDTPVMQEIFRYEPTGPGGPGFRATGIVPRVAARCRERGVALPVEWFSKGGAA